MKIPVQLERTTRLGKNISFTREIFNFTTRCTLSHCTQLERTYLSYVRQPTTGTFDPTKKEGMKYQSPRFSLFKAKNRARRAGETQFFMSDLRREERKRKRQHGE